MTNWIRSFVVLTAAAVMVGCGGGADTKPVGKVSGKVTAGGQPVTGGELLFSPSATAGNSMPGKAGRAVIKSDGTYSVSTYGDGDGAVVGTHTVSFMAPPPETDEHGQVKGEAKFGGLTPSAATYEVKSGSNTIDIELVAKPDAAPM